MTVDELNAAGGIKLADGTRAKIVTTWLDERCNAEEGIWPGRARAAATSTLARVSGAPRPARCLEIGPRPGASAARRARGREGAIPATLALGPAPPPQDPRVPCPRKNQASCVALQAPAARFASLLPSLAQEVRGAIPGSDPGICAAGPQRVTPAILAFGRRVQRTLVKRGEALAAEAGLHLEALGGTGDGVIGALAAVALRASGADGRFTALGRIRGLRGILPVSDLLAAGPIARVCDRAGRALPPEARVDTVGRVRPRLRDGEPVLVVAPGADRLWRPVRLA